MTDRRLPTALGKMGSWSPISIVAGSLLLSDDMVVATSNERMGLLICFDHANKTKASA